MFGLPAFPSQRPSKGSQIMRTFLQIASVIGLVLGTAVGGFYLLNNLVLGREELKDWLPVAAGLTTVIFSAIIWVFVDVADRLAPVEKITLDKLFPERKLKSTN